MATTRYALQGLKKIHTVRIQGYTFSLLEFEDHHWEANGQRFMHKPTNGELMDAYNVQYLLGERGLLDMNGSKEMHLQHNDMPPAPDKPGPILDPTVPKAQHTAKLVEFPTTAMLDIPAALRALADGIEAGNYGQVNTLGWVIDHDEQRIDVGLAGKSPLPGAELHLLLACGMRKLESVADVD